MSRRNKATPKGGQKPNTAWPPALISMLLTWEKVRSWNAGIDFAAFDSRLTGSFEYFIRQTLDMVGPADELPVILGTSVPSTNNTDLQTEGWELELSWRDVAFGQLNYGIRLVLSDAQATAIVEMRLRQLTGLEREKLQSEYDELMKFIHYHTNVKILKVFMPLLLNH